MYYKRQCNVITLYLHEALLAVNDKNAVFIKNSHRVDPVAVKTNPCQPALIAALFASRVPYAVHQLDQRQKHGDHDTADDDGQENNHDRF